MLSILRQSLCIKQSSSVQILFYRSRSILSVTVWGAGTFEIHHWAWKTFTPSLALSCLAHVGQAGWHWQLNAAVFTEFYRVPVRVDICLSLSVCCLIMPVTLAAISFFDNNFCSFSKQIYHLWERKSLGKYSSTVSNRSSTHLVTFTLLLLHFVYLFCFILHYTHSILHFIVYLYKSDYIKPYFILMLCYVILLYNICYVILYHNTDIASLYLISNTTSSTYIILMLHWLVIFYVTLLSYLYI